MAAVEPTFAVKLGNWSCLCLCGEPPPGTAIMWEAAYNEILISTGTDERQTPQSGIYKEASSALPSPKEDTPSVDIKRDLGSPSMLPQDDGNGSKRTSSEAGSLEKLAFALQCGHFADAFRELEALKAQGVNPHNVLDGTQVEQINRIASHYSTSLVKVQPPDSSFVVETHGLHKGGIRIADGGMEIRIVFDFDDCDMLRAWGALVEADMNLGFGRKDPTGADFIQCNELPGVRSAFDTLWHITAVAKAINVRSDNIWHASYANALSDSEPMLWHAMYNPDADAEEILGVVLPPAEKDVARVGTAWGYYTARPSPTGKNAFKLVMTTGCETSPTMFKIMSWLPHFILRRLLRESLENFPSELRRATQDTRLHQRMNDGPRAEYYKQIQKQLEEMTPIKDKL